MNKKTIILIIIFFIISFSFFNYNFTEFLPSNTYTEASSVFLKYSLPVFVHEEDANQKENFRNPFSDYRRDQDFRNKNDKQNEINEGEVTENQVNIKALKTYGDVWQEIPFILRGIISYRDRNIALISINYNSKIVNKGDEIGSFTIADIYEDSVEISHQQLQRSIKMEIGGGILKIEN